MSRLDNLRSIPRTGTPGIGGIPFRACLYFAAHPEASLTPPELSAMFGMPAKSASSTFRAIIIAGFISKKLQRGKERARYSAGPELLKVIGAPVPVVEEDDDRCVQRIRPASACQAPRVARTPLEMAWAA